MGETHAELPSERAAFSAQVTHTHTVIVDGVVVYQGQDWNEATRIWLEYGKDLNNQYVEHRMDGVQLAIWGKRP